MIVGDKRDWLRMIFTLRGSIIGRIWPRIVTVTAFACLVTWIEIRFDLETYTLTTIPFTLIGLAMAIFLGFRNNEAYDRYWEGRTLWGALVNVSRSLTRRSKMFIQSPTGKVDGNVERIRCQLTILTIAYVNSLRHHLRGSDGSADLESQLTADEIRQVTQHVNQPIGILQLMGELITEAWQAGYVKDYHLPQLEDCLTDMTNVQGGCERINGTPIPFTYNVLIHRIVAMYCFALPLGILSTTLMATPLVVALISYAFFGLDAIGDEVEQPFDRDDNDLPLEAICRTIEINLLQMLGEEEVPPPIEPVKSVLL